MDKVVVIGGRPTYPILNVDNKKIDKEFAIPTIEYVDSPGLNTIVATGAITKALHAGKINLLGEAGGDAAVALTLPAATGTGDKYKFIVSVVNTSGYSIAVVDAATVISGSILSINDSATLLGWLAGSTADTVTLDGTTMGGVSIGDWVEFTDIATNQWAINGLTNSSGTEATPFSAAVT